MNTSLEQLFTDIADAIRTRTGTTEAIPALAMPNRILGITGDQGSENSFDPGNFGKYYVTHGFSVDGNNVSFSMSKQIFPTLPKLIVVPCVMDDSSSYGGSFVMVRDEKKGYRLFFNGKELEHMGNEDFSDDSAYNISISFSYDTQLYTSCQDELEMVMFWL